MQKSYAKPASDNLDLHNGRLEYMLNSSPCLKPSVCQQSDCEDFATKLTQYLALKYPKTALGGQSGVVNQAQFHLILEALYKRKNPTRRESLPKMTDFEHEHPIDINQEMQILAEQRPLKTAAAANLPEQISRKVTQSERN